MHRSTVMQFKSIHILSDPKTHKPLHVKNNTLETIDTGKIYPIINGIPVFLKEEDVHGINKKYQAFYDKAALLWGLTEFVYGLFKDIVRIRRNLLGSLNIKPHDKVLEISIGTGINITLFDKQADYYGIDISIGMLQVCQKNNKKWKYDLELFQANAEELPFRDNSFDVVFHLGGINFFNDIQKAILEMIRVAKPGAQILVCDETQEYVDSFYKRLPFVRRYFLDSSSIDRKQVVESFIPSTMENVKTELTLNNSFYIITFNKPAK